MKKLHHSFLLSHSAYKRLKALRENSEYFFNTKLETSNILELFVWESINRFSKEKQKFLQQEVDRINEEERIAFVNMQKQKEQKEPNQ